MSTTLNHCISTLSQMTRFTLLITRRLLMDILPSFPAINKHRRLLPANCHNLCDVVRWRRIHNTWPVAALTAVKPDTGSESRFQPTPHAFDTPVRGFLWEYCHAVWYGKTRMVWLPDGEKILKISLFVLTECMNVTDTQTPHDSIGHAYA